MADFHKIWIDQCEATEGLCERFGADDAIRYLVGEKFINFIQASDTRPEFAAELPEFVSKIKEIFEIYQISDYFAKREEAAAVDRNAEWVFDSFEDAELDPYDMVVEAQQVMLIERAKELLL